jgi:acyl carrier protein
MLAENVREEVARVLGLSAPSEVDPARGLFDMGMDSLMAVELRSRLQKRSGKPLPSTLTFNYPSAAALTQFLEQLLFGMPAVAAESEGKRALEAVEAPGTASDTARDDMSEEELERLLAEKLKML